MKKISTHFHQAFLSLFFILFIASGTSAQCLLQGTISEPGCGSSNTTPNVGGMQEWNLSSTIGADYTVSISSGSNGCGTYSVAPSSFTATGSTTVVDIQAGGTCCWAASGTSATLTYTRIGYTNTTATSNLCQGSTRNLTVSPAPFTAGTWSVIPGTGNGTISGSTFTATAAGTVTIRYSKGGCNSDISFTIDAAPTTATVGSSQSICGLVSNGLGGNTPAVGTGTWTKTSGPGTVTFSNANTGNATATVSAYGTYTFQWSIANGVCSPSTASVTVTYYQTPTTATVGATQNICGSLTTASLGGNTPTVGTGTWTQTSGPGTTTFSAAGSGSSTATASVTGTYVYTWTIANGTCTSSSANVTVNYYATPTTATVGGTQNLCGTLTSTSLGGNSPTVGTGTWSQTAGPGTTTFSNPASPSASAIASVAGTYTYTWTITNGTCTPSTADVQVNFYATPPVATIIPSTQYACGTLTSPALGANAAAPGTGTWTLVSGPGTATFSNVNAENATATVTATGSYVFRWTITNGNCAATTADVTVTYYTAPTTAQGGPQQSVCALISGPLGANSPVVGTGQWSQYAGPGVTFFSNSTFFNSTASVSVQGTYVFAWTISNGACTSVAYDTVNFYSNPTIATVGSDQRLCGTLTSSPLGGNVPAIGTGAWSQIAGPGTTTFSNPASGSSTATASVYGVYTYEWTISNGTCTPTTADVTVYYIPSPSGGSIPDAAFCSAVGSSSISVVGVANATRYTWALPAGLTGSSTTSNIGIGGTTPGTYTVTVTPANVQFGITCTGTPITGTVTILSQPVIDSINPGLVSCYGGSNDTIRVYAHTSNGSLFYSIDNGLTFPNTTGTFPNLIAGSYNVQVRDDSTCTTSYTGNPVIVTQPSAISVTIASYSNVRCSGDSTGFINIAVSGGTPPYTYAWDNGANTQNIINLAAGSYTVSVTDANGCVKTLTQIITSPAIITATATGTNISCYHANDGTASVTASGGAGTLIYTWSDGSNASSLTGLAAALYSVTIEDGNGCQVVRSYTVTEPAPLSLSLSSTNVTCFGNGNGTLSASVTGGTGAYTYTWSPAVSAGPTVTGAAPGTYILTVSDVNNCSVVDSAVITQPLSGLSVSSIVTPVRCTGESNGAIQLLPSGGVGGYTYSWAGGQSLQIISGLSANIYNATVTDGNGCQVTVADTLTDPTPIISSVAGTSASCVGAGGGSATLTVSGGVAPYTFLWSNFEATQNISNLSGGTYRVIITDANGCQHSDSVVITQPQPLVATFSVTNATCSGTLGSVSVNVTGGTGSYTYAWTPSGSVTNTVSPAPSGTYIVTVTDGNGCTLVDSTTVLQPQALSALLSVTDVKCFGDTTGKISVSAFGGSGSYTYTWSPAVSTAATALNLDSGIYYVTVTDGNGCTVQDSALVSQPASPIIVTSVIHNVTCSGGHDGSILAVASGGTGSYTYHWSTGDSIQYITNLSVSPLANSTLYRLTVTDANGCEARITDTLRSPLPIITAITGTDVTCAGADNGSATLTVSGGRGPYTFFWSNATIYQNLSSVGGGTYTVVITDSLGCRAVDSVTIHEPQPLVLNVTSTNVTCFGAGDGTITATVTGGTGAYTYTWSPAVSATGTVTNAAPGTYSLTVTDANGCTATASVAITQPASAVLLSASTTDISCHDANDGSITTQVSGGSGAYTYAWTGVAATTPSVSGLAAGAYTVTVTDGNGCTATGGGTITNPADISSTTTGTNLLCAGAANGTASVTTVTGGTGSYTYLWSNFAATQTISGLNGGLYRVVITDAHGCQHRDSVFVTEPQPLALSISYTSPGCAGGSNGTITATVSGGTGTYTYTWMPNVSSGPTVSNVSAGTYHLTVTDANGCSISDSVVIPQPAAVLTASTLVTDISCHDADNGSITTLVSGGSGTYTYAWTGSAATTATIGGLSTGTYTVTVTDLGGCTASATGTITNPSAITSTTSGTNVTCAGAGNGTAAISTVAGGTGPYTFLWSTFEATQSISGLSGGIYRVVITDAHGCEHRDSVIVTEPQPLVATLSITQITCNNQNNGSITVATTGGTGTVAYLWSPGGQLTPTISGLSAGTYSVVATDANGCTAGGSATIVNPGILSSTSLVTNPTCNTGTGNISLVVNGGTQSYTYSWSGALAGSGSSATNVAPGTYYVTVTDAHGCTVTDSARVQAPAPIFISGIVTNVSCHGNADGSVISTVYGGTQPYAYQWHFDSLAGATGPITKDWLQLSGGEYYLAVTDANNCAVSFHATIRESDSLKLTLSETNVTCFGLTNGTLHASPSGGTTPYHFLWNNFVTDSVQSGVPAGNYGVVVTDSNGCQQTKTINISQPAALVSHVTAVNPACSGQSSGTATVAVSGGGGAGTYNYAWGTTPAQNTATATGLSAGTYYVTVTDGNGCSLTDSAALTAPQALAVNTAISNPTCADGSNGFVSLDVRQGTAPYAYSWNTTPAQSGNVASGLTAGTYIATITDAGGCQLLDTAIVVAPAPITISLTGLGSTTCLNSADGYVVLSVTGGLAPYIYQVGTQTQSSDTFRNLTPGTYSLSVRDANTCEATTSWTIASSSSFSVDLTVDHDVILAGETIQLTATPTSDTTVTGYTWLTQDSSLNFSACGNAANCPNPTAIPQASYTYVVQAANARGCIATDTVHVTVSNQPSAFMPSAFTPNGDGNNDRFQVDILGAKDMHVQVWNRWGEKVYDNPVQKNGVDQSSSEGWDGYFRGKLVEFGTYIYQLDVSYLNGQTKTISGTITVMH